MLIQSSSFYDFPAHPQTSPSTLVDCHSLIDPQRNEEIQFAERLKLPSNGAHFKLRYLSGCLKAHCMILFSLLLFCLSHTFFRTDACFNALLFDTQLLST